MPVEQEGNALPATWTEPATTAPLWCMNTADNYMYNQWKCGQQQDFTHPTFSLNEHDPLLSNHKSHQNYIDSRQNRTASARAGGQARFFSTPYAGRMAAIIPLIAYGSDKTAAGTGHNAALCEAAGGKTETQSLEGQSRYRRAEELIPVRRPSDDMTTPTRQAMTGASQTGSTRDVGIDSVQCIHRNQYESETESRNPACGSVAPGVVR